MFNNFVILAGMVSRVLSKIVARFAFRRDPVFVKYFLLNFMLRLYENRGPASCDPRPRVNGLGSFPYKRKREG